MFSVILVENSTLQLYKKKIRYKWKMPKAKKVSEEEPLTQDAESTHDAVCDWQSSETLQMTQKCEWWRCCRPLPDSLHSLCPKKLTLPFLKNAA